MLIIENRRSYFNIDCDAKPSTSNTVIDRSKVATALAKAIAFKQVRNDQKANEWAKELVALLECADILK